MPAAAHAADDFRTWSGAIDDVLRIERLAFRRAIVLHQVDSTQEEARRRAAVPGDLIIAASQNAGRGRLGRRWHDERGEGVAITAVLDPFAPEHQPRASIAAAVAAALAIESALHQQVGIKWPNDIIAMHGTSPRKLAGILIEQDHRIAAIGIGVNVLQARWPAELRDRAISLRQLSCSASRLDVIIAIIGSLDRALAMRNDQLAEHFTRRNALSGQDATFQVDGEVIGGRVLRIDPMRGLAVLTDAGERWLPAATTTVIEWPRGRSRT